MTNTALLKVKIKESGLKICFLASSLGLSRSGFSKKLCGLHPFNQFEIQHLCSLLNITSLEEKENIFFAQNVDKSVSVAGG